MTSRIKKLFHRGKDDDNGALQHYARTPATARSNPAIRTSMYDSTTAGTLPQTGDYPIRGNDSSVILRSGRKSSFRSSRSRRSSSRGSQYNTSLRAVDSTQYDGIQADPHVSQQASIHAGVGSHNTQPDVAEPTGIREDQLKRRSHSRLPQELGNLSLGELQSPTTVTHTVTTTRTGPQVQHASRHTPQAQPLSKYKSSIKSPTPYFDGVLQNHQDARNGGRLDGLEGKSNVNLGAVDSADGQQFSVPNANRDTTPESPGFHTHSKLRDHGEYDGGLVRQESIPRKQVGTSTQMPQASASIGAAGPRYGHNKHGNVPKVLPLTTASLSNDDNVRWTGGPSDSGSTLDISKPIIRGTAAPRDAQNIVNRAKGNTDDTEIIEKVAPAVVHEKISKDIHHVREELITKEVHTHDVYHRILPIIDVEVLPPRHFLPVEGGGLVEVSASEVPGRGSNWVIAETASKIPSDQAARRGARGFTARDFSGQEGDSSKYISPEGHEKTEQSWVHPPELEEGARITGQSWPMVFGDDRAQQESVAHSTPKSAKRKSPKRRPATEASPAQRVG
ncbi:hypothetical protein ACLMJK_003350 [Lecanora helva]